jgi:hypothetical protein
MPHSGLPDRQIEASLEIIHDFLRIRKLSALTNLLQRQQG